MEFSALQAHFGCSADALKLPVVAVVGPDSSSVSGVLFWDVPAQVPHLEIELFSLSERAHSLRLLGSEAAVRPGQAGDRHKLAANTFCSSSSVKAEAFVGGRLAKYDDIKASASKVSEALAEAYAADLQARAEGMCGDAEGVKSESLLQADSALGLPSLPDKKTLSAHTPLISGVDLLEPCPTKFTPTNLSSPDICCLELVGPPSYKMSSFFRGCPFMQLCSPLLQKPV